MLNKACVWSGGPSTLIKTNYFVPLQSIKYYLLDIVISYYFDDLTALLQATTEVCTAPTL